MPKICEVLGLIPGPQNRKKVDGYVSNQQLRQRASLVCEAFEGGTSQGDEALTFLEPYNALGEWGGTEKKETNWVASLSLGVTDGN